MFLKLLFWLWLIFGIYIMLNSKLYFLRVPNSNDQNIGHLIWCFDVIWVFETDFCFRLVNLVFLSLWLTNVGVLWLHEKLPIRIWWILWGWYHLHGWSWTRSLWGATVPFLSCQAWLEISWHWWISGNFWSSLFQWYFFSDVSFRYPKLLATTLQVASIHKLANSFQHLLSQCFWPWELLLGQYAPVTFFF